MSGVDSAWFFAANNDRQGPFSRDQMVGMARDGRLMPETLVWTEGMAGWMAMGQTPLAALVQAAGAPRPMPAPPPPQPSAWVAPNGASPAYAGAAAYGPAPVQGFGEAIGVCLRKYVTFSGRANRPEYWYFVLFNVICAIGLTVLDVVLFGDASYDSSGYNAAVAGIAPFSSLFSLAMLLPNLAVWVRRMHDVNRSGWWVFIALVPLVGAILLLVWACSRGTEGPNPFG